MKILIGYPPLWKKGKIPLLGQNRQFRYSSSHEVRIYPIVPSVAATMLANSGHSVLYLDGIVKRLTSNEFMQRFTKFNPDLVAIETKTPIIRKHWEFINEVKNEFRDTYFVLMGDHLTYDAEESFKYSSVDFVITGGDYDVSIYNLVNYLDNRKNKLPSGIYYRENGRIKNTGKFKLISNLDELPFIDRTLTKWWRYGEAYLYHPCTYMMWGRGCYPGRCSFCVWESNFWQCKPRLRSVQNALDEIEMILNNLKVKEIFDDTDTSIWNKKWVHKLCQGLIDRKLNDSVRISCNARADNLTKETCRYLKKAGFRLLKVGLESGNDDTLQRIQKKETIEQIRQGVKNAKDAGLRVFLTIMVGYPWETEEHFKNTFKLVKELMLYKTHVGDSLQASLVIPYPGTPLYFEAIENDWFTIDPKDYEKFDMSQPVLKTSLPASKIMSSCERLWRIHLDNRFKLKTLLSIRSWNDIELIWRGLKSVQGHKRDF